MRIGLFTDTYFPNTNGIAYVVHILQKNLESLGHEAFIFAPEPRARHWFRRREHNVIRFPALEGLFFEEQLTSFFFPSRQLKKITDLQLDAIIIFTPAQVGLMGVYAAMRNDIPLIEQYSTDLVEYIKRYPATLPAVMALLLASPVVLKVSPKRVLHASRAISKTNDTISQELARQGLNLVHERCDGIIAVSEKSARQIAAYSGGAHIGVIPTGVDALPLRQKESQHWRRRWHADDETVVFMYVGRLSKEKNIELLLASYEKVANKSPNSRLIIVGSFSHEDVLKQHARSSHYPDKIIFTGRIPRDRLGPLYAAADVFCFPSVTDTQALVINEAAHAGLPIVWCDPLLNAVAKDGTSGVLARPNQTSFAAAMQQLADNRSLRKLYGKNARSAASKLTEMKQTKQLVKFISQFK